MIDIKQLTESTLNIPVLELSDPILSPCCTWQLLHEELELSGNGQIKEISETYEINLWIKSRKEVMDKTKTLRKALLDIKYITFPNTSFTFDRNGSVWRGSIMFKHIKEDADVNG